MAKKKTTRKSANKDDDQAQIVRGNVNREMVVSPTFVSLYANDAQIQTSPWDVKLTFGEMSVQPTTEKPTAIIKQVGEVRMSPQLAKQLVKVMVEQLTVYETRFGAIPQPPD